MRKSLAALLIFSASLAAQLTPPGGGGGGSSGQYSLIRGLHDWDLLLSGRRRAGREWHTHECSHTAGIWRNDQQVLGLVSRGAGSGSAVFTWYDGTSSQTVTCTVAASANGCSDTTHSFTYSAGDLLSIQMVVSTATITSAVTMTWGTGQADRRAQPAQPEPRVPREQPAQPG